MIFRGQPTTPLITPSRGVRPSASSQMFPFEAQFTGSDGTSFADYTPEQGRIDYWDSGQWTLQSNAARPLSGAFTYPRFSLNDSTPANIDPYSVNWTTSHRVLTKNVTGWSGCLRMHDATSYWGFGISGYGDKVLIREGSTIRAASASIREFINTYAEVEVSFSGGTCTVLCEGVSCQYALPSAWPQCRIDFQVSSIDERFDWVTADYL